jgi:hypothetical protein
LLETRIQALCDDGRHELSRVVLPLAAVEPQRELQRVGEMFGLRGRETNARVVQARG